MSNIELTAESDDVSASVVSGPLVAESVVADSVEVPVLELLFGLLPLLADMPPARNKTSAMTKNLIVLSANGVLPDCCFLCLLNHLFVC